MKKYVILLIVGLLLSLDSPAQGFFKSLNKALNGLTQDSQQRNRYSDRQRSSYDRRQRTENTRMSKNKEGDRNNRANEIIDEEPSAKMLKEGSKATKEREATTEPQSNEKVITLVVNGTGETKEDATKNALRSAIEQAFGTFVSANTEVLNDELIKDEITTVSTGNIKSFKELSVSQTSNGLYDASVQATVSIDQLTKFAQSKGMQAELAGATFVMNMKMRELNKNNELLAIDHMMEKAKVIAKKGLFDYRLEIGEPQFAGNNYTIKIKILFCENENTKLFYETIYKTLYALSMTDAEQTEYDNVNLKYVKYDREQLLRLENFGYCKTPLVLRNSFVGYGDGFGRYKDLYSWMMPIVMEGALNYVIKDNIGNIWCCSHEKGSLDELKKRGLHRDITNLIWGYMESPNGIGHLYMLTPSIKLLDSNGLGSYSSGSYNNNYGIPIINYESKKYVIQDYYNSNLLFNPMLKFGKDSFSDVTRYNHVNKGLEMRIKERIYFEQEIIVVYTEEELSKLKSVEIEHREH